MIDISDLAYLTHHSATLEEVHILASALAELVEIAESGDLFTNPQVQELAARVAQRPSVKRAVLERGGDR